MKAPHLNQGLSEKGLQVMGDVKGTVDASLVMMVEFKHDSHLTVVSLPSKTSCLAKLVSAVSCVFF